MNTKILSNLKSNSSNKNVITERSFKFCDMLNFFKRLESKTIQMKKKEFKNDDENDKRVYKYDNIAAVNFQEKTCERIEKNLEHNYSIINKMKDEINEIKKHNGDIISTKSEKEINLHESIVCELALDIQEVVSEKNNDIYINKPSISQIHETIDIDTHNNETHFENINNKKEIKKIEPNEHNVVDNENIDIKKFENNKNNKTNKFIGVNNKNNKNNNVNPNEIKISESNKRDDCNDVNNKCNKSIDGNHNDVRNKDNINVDVDNLDKIKELGKIEESSINNAKLESKINDTNEVTDSKNVTNNCGTEMGLDCDPIGDLDFDVYDTINKVNVYEMVDNLDGRDYALAEEIKNRPKYNSKKILFKKLVLYVCNALVDNKNEAEQDLIPNEGEIFEDPDTIKPYNNHDGIRRESERLLARYGGSHNLYDYVCLDETDFDLNKINEVLSKHRLVRDSDQESKLGQSRKSSRRVTFLDETIVHEYPKCLDIVDESSEESGVETQEEEFVSVDNTEINLEGQHPDEGKSMVKSEDEILVDNNEVNIEEPSQSQNSSEIISDRSFKFSDILNKWKSK